MASTQCLHFSVLLTFNFKKLQTQTLPHAKAVGVCHDTKDRSNLVSSPRLETSHGWEECVSFDFLTRKSDPAIGHTHIHTHTHIYRAVSWQNERGKTPPLFCKVNRL